jgi:hypothetical protein
VIKKPYPETQVPALDAPLSSVDESFTRSEGYIDPAVRQRLKKYFDMPAPPYSLPTNAGNDEFKLKRIIKTVLAFVRGRLHL